MKKFYFSKENNVNLVFVSLISCNKFYLTKIKITKLLPSKNEVDTRVYDKLKIWKWKNEVRH